MPAFVPKTTASPDSLDLLNALSRAYKAVSMHDANQLRESGMDLTAAQADVILTLGGTDGMTCADIGNETLITKGTLTGVIDRLRAKGLVERWEDAYDARRTVVALTRAGEKIHKSLLPRQLEQLEQKLAQVSSADRKRATRILHAVAVAFGKA